MVIASLPDYFKINVENDYRKLSSLAFDTKKNSKIKRRKNTNLYQKEMHQYYRSGFSIWKSIESICNGFFQKNILFFMSSKSNKSIGCR